MNFTLKSTDMHWTPKAAGISHFCLAADFTYCDYPLFSWEVHSLYSCAIKCDLFCPVEVSSFYIKKKSCTGPTHNELQIFEYGGHIPIFMIAL